MQHGHFDIILNNILYTVEGIYHFEPASFYDPGFVNFIIQKVYDENENDITLNISDDIMDALYAEAFSIALYHKEDICFNDDYI